MTRARYTIAQHARHRKVLKMAKGYRGRNKNTYRVALEKVEKALQYAYRDRRNRKRDFRRLWFQRINARVRQHGLRYSEFINRLKHTGIIINRKMLADLAVHEPQVFETIIQKVNKTS